MTLLRKNVINPFVTGRNLLIGFIVILVIGAGIFGLVSKFRSDLAAPSPTPRPDIIFNRQSTDSAQPANNIESKKVNKQYTKFPGLLPAAEITNKKAVIETSKGKIEFEIYPQSPKAASNFVFLVKEGFYDGLNFHRVVPGFVIQGGDPAGNGTGGPGYSFEDEPVALDYSKGIVAMANAGPNTNGSQFFIMLSDHLELPKQYTIFGRVISGQEVVDKIQVGDVMEKITIESSN